MGPTGRHAVLQIHPTRRCNLRCLHCYSDSSPDEQRELPVETLVDAIHDAAQLGYTALAVSGGEPLLYAPLARLLEAAESHGMVRTVTTNGMLPTNERIALLA